MNARAVARCILDKLTDGWTVWLFSVLVALASFALFPNVTFDVQATTEIASVVHDSNETRWSVSEATITRNGVKDTRSFTGSIEPLPSTRTEIGRIGTGEVTMRLSTGSFDHLGPVAYTLSFAEKPDSLTAGTDIVVTKRQGEPFVASFAGSLMIGSPTPTLVTPRLALAQSGHIRILYDFLGFEYEGESTVIGAGDIVQGDGAFGTIQAHESASLEVHANYLTSGLSIDRALGGSRQLLRGTWFDKVTRHPLAQIAGAVALLWAIRIAIQSQRDRSGKRNSGSLD